MNMLDVFRKLKKQTGSEVYLVGGFVRDYLRRKRNLDLDIVIQGINQKHIINFLKKYGKIKVLSLPKLAGKGSKPIILFSRANNKNYSVQITVIGDRRTALKRDALSRDFTINALYLPIDFKSHKDVIDMVGGKNDIVHRRIMTVGDVEKTFANSPIRILRAMSLSARTGYKISDNILYAIRHTLPSDVRTLKDVPKENIRAELEEILLSKRPSTYLRLMHKVRLLGTILPEVDGCIGVKQDTKYHKYDVFEHCARACDAIEPALVLRWAALLHDIGKPSTRKVIGDRITFHKHEMVGVKLTKELLDRLKYDTVTKKEIIQLVRLHMYHYTREFSNTAVRKFIRKVGINKTNIGDLDSLPLFKLRAAERLGNGLKTIAVTERQLDFQKRIQDIFSESQGFTIKDLRVNGEKIMTTFHLKPSKKVGVILGHLLERVLAEPTLNNEQDLLKLSADFLAGEIYSRILE